MTSQKVNDHTIEDFVDRKGTVADVIRMIIRMFNELKESI
jgi:hypothetical protein